MRFIPLRSRPMITGLIIQGRQVRRASAVILPAPSQQASPYAPPLLFLLNRHPASLSRAHSLRTLALCWSCGNRQPTP